MSQSLLGLVLMLVCGALTLAGAIGFGTKPNRRSVAAVLTFGALAAYGWWLVSR